ncbi:MAG: YolA family protein [Hyphomicrobiales bacterium]|nr:YolA family protein [Hyphomicrobiales bacterium]
MPEGLDLASSEPAALRAPAPPLTYAQIRGVRSSDSGNAWVIVSDGAFNSGFNHGGAQMFVLVIEIGYGNSIVARMNGAVLPTSANVLNERKCNVGGFLGDCSPGQTVVGWYRYFDVSGAQGGLFQYQNTSINAPFNTLSDRLTIL